MSDVFLTEEHELQVQAYLRFAKLKREQHVRETVSVVKEFKQDHFTPGEVYNYNDINQLFSTLEREVHDLVDKEVQHSYHTSALLVQLLLNQAQAGGVEMHIDTNQLENEFLLKQVAGREQTALSRPASDFIRRNAQLSKLGHVGTVSVLDPRLMKERDAAKAEAGSAQERLAALQEQTTAMMREKSTLNQQLEQLKAELAAKDAQLQKLAGGDPELMGKLAKDFANLSAQAADAASLSTAQFQKLQGDLNRHRQDLEAARRELALAQHEAAIKEKEARDAKSALDNKLQDSKQWQQMKKLMQQKSTDVVTLRKRLSKYEPQSVPDADTPDPTFD